MSVKANPGTIYVSPGSSIQDAINIANSGDTVFVLRGTYSEHIVVNNSINLVGEDVEATIIDGYGIGTVINVTANSAVVEGFTIRNSGADSGDSAILLESFIGNVISNNKIVNNKIGIIISTSYNNIISNNTISNNDEAGLYLYSSGENTISGNVIQNNNYYGIKFHSSINNLISGNTISFNKLGAYLYFYSSSNVFYHNNFNNTNQVTASETTNAWNYGGEGNYWGDYTGPDMDNDGIGDTPYVIDPINRDNFPLMGPFSVFNINLEQKTYQVAFVSNSTISAFRFEIGAETGNQILRFNATGQNNTVGFCRVAIPMELMNYPFIVTVDTEEVVPTLLSVSNETYRYIYFKFTHSVRAISIISSRTLYLYDELLGQFSGLQTDLHSLNMTYYELLYNYTALMENYSLLQEVYQALNSSYQEHLSNYSEDMDNFRNLTYIFAATTAIFLATTVYLSKRAHTGLTTRKGVAEEK
jgi:parallel beta-helix repeat protein